MTYTNEKYRGKLDLKRVNGTPVGKDLGFEQLHKYFTLKIGYPLVVYGMPRSGKTEVVFEMQIQASVIHGMKHYILSPETGDPEDILLELVHKYVGKPVYKSEKNAMTEAEYQQGLDWVNKHFYICDPEKTFSVNYGLKEVYEDVKEVEMQGGWKFQTISIDPWTELTLDNREGRDIAVSKSLAEMRRHDRENKTTTIAIPHTSEISPILDKQAGTTYFPLPKPSQIAGGQMWYRRAFSIIGVYRPDPDFFTDAAYNEAWILIQKFKPKGGGGEGMVKWYFDKHKNRYYEKINGYSIYGKGSNIDMKVEPNENIDDLWENDSQPF